MDPSSTDIPESQSGTNAEFSLNEEQRRIEITSNNVNNSKNTTDKEDNYSENDVRETENSESTVAGTENSESTVAGTENPENAVAETENSESTVAGTENPENAVTETENSETNQDETVLEMFDISPDLSNGVKKQILKEGEGDEYPGYGDKVSVHYTGWLLSNRQVFDSTRKGENVEFCLGRGQVIKGWDIGLATMKRGEIALFIVEPQYAYGEAGYPPVIPPYSPLLFEVELCDWKLEDLSFKKDNGILRKIITKGEGTTSPNEGSLVKVKLVGTYDDKIFEDTEKEFIHGEGCISNIPEGIEVALLRFHLKEKSIIYLKSQYAFEKGSDEFDIPPDADVQYEVSLLEFEKAKDVWEMDSDEKLLKAKTSKEKGISFIQAGKIKAALKQFRWILVCLEKEPGVSSDTEDERKSLLMSGYLNLALCYLKLENYVDAVKICDNVLDMDPNSEKALFRRGQAKMQINDCSEALADFEKLISLYPENKAARQSRLLCHEKMKKQNFKDKNVYSKMFEKFVKQDEERIRNMKTETGVWENKESNESENSESHLDQNKKLYEQHGAVLRDANVVELSNTACL